MNAVTDALLSQKKTRASRLSRYALICGILLLNGIPLYSQINTRPNIIIIYADDLGYGDVGSYGATKIATPNIDRLAATGRRFTNAHATSATCTPSRFSLLTGKYAWRKSGTGVAPGDAALIIPTTTPTMASMMRKAGYRTGVIGKWHLGLGGVGGPDWNATIKPGAGDLGFNYSFIMPATGDRVPCVYVENGFVVNRDSNDPILVDYKQKIGSEPTGKENPEQLKMSPSHGHNNTIINGVSRIGWMAGGKAARWVDEDMAQLFTAKAADFIRHTSKQPFFLYFATHDIHVPRLPNAMFAGKSGLGPRGDALLQLDWCVGQLLDRLAESKVLHNTVIIFTSDNGPVLDDGYNDEAVTKLNGHNPTGPLRGGKYSLFNGGTRVPFIISWPSKIRAGTTTNALFSQIDLYSSIGGLLSHKLQQSEAPDSFNMLSTLLGKADHDREYLVQQAVNNKLAIIQGEWKYIEPAYGPALNLNTNIETGNYREPQLYNLKNDTEERNNLAEQYPDITKRLAALLNLVRKQ